ncbi:MAG: hypothetical protein PHU25_22375, partial [Deltaproteobacteria bacterium]|nr:hypothetical protein [Deltaproteobacteria bacterium]
APSCVSLGANPENCGRCGRSCSENAWCKAGRCAPRTGELCSLACGASRSCFYDLFGFPRCVETQQSRWNCGAYGHVCGCSETCVGGRCVPLLSVVDPCPFGLVNCGGELGLSCQNLKTDPRNCGGCGLSCPGGATCANGSCLIKDEQGIPDNCGGEEP